MTRIVALLEAKGLVRLEPHPDDRRQKMVSQTEQAEAMLAESRTKRNAVLSHLAEGLDEDEREMLWAAAPVLEKLATCDPGRTGVTPSPYRMGPPVRGRRSQRDRHTAGPGRSPPERPSSRPRRTARRRRLRR
ncbi:hypothetical protein SMICM304S_07510 [Streptomyces microflavus]